MAMARILRPAKTAMSSGRGKTKHWVLEYEQATKREAEPLMGWISAKDTLNQIRLKFESREQAEAYAIQRNIPYIVEEPHERSLKPKAYADNFRWDKTR